MKKDLCGFLGPCIRREGNYCGLIPGACDKQIGIRTESKPIQECCLCTHRKVCKYREEFEKKKDSTYIKLECKYFTN
jgi:hypothetical protein